MEPSKHLEVRWSWDSKEATVAGDSRAENWRGKCCAEFQRSAEGSLYRELSIDHVCVRKLPKVGGKPT